VAPQVAQGLNAGLWIEDDCDEVSPVVANAKELFLIVQEHPFNPYGDEASPNDPLGGCYPFGGSVTFMCALQHRCGLMADLQGDMMYKVEINEGRGFSEGLITPFPHFFSLNGQFAPNHRMSTGEFYRVRWVYAGHNIPLKLQIGPGHACEWALLAKDGVMISPYPRYGINHVWIGPASRVDVLLRCTHPGNYTVYQDNYVSNWQDELNEINIPVPNETLKTSFDYTWNQTILTLEVTGDVVPVEWPATAIPDRPRYLQDLLNLPMDMIATPNVHSAPECPGGATGDGIGGDPDTCRQPYVQKVLLDHADPSKKTLNMIMDYDFPANATLGPLANSETSYATAPVRFVVNNETYRHRNSTAQYQAVYQIGDIVRINMGGVKRHAWHIHEMPVQFETLPCTTQADADLYDYCTNNLTIEDMYDGFFRIGDWHDALMLMPPDAYSVAGGNDNKANPGFPPIPTRAMSDCYTGPVLIHCHVLYHEDLGMMALINIEGEDHTYNPYFGQDGIFNYPPAQCTQPGNQCAPPDCTDYVYAE
jgi:FtsP/CotA-like multicopper oxidase with cupredoxin domain